MNRHPPLAASHFFWAFTSSVSAKPRRLRQAKTLQCLDPVLEPSGLALDVARCPEAVGQQRGALERGQEVDGKLSRLVFFAHRPELRREPRQCVGEEPGGLLGKRSAFFLQFGAERPDRTSVPSQVPAIVDRHLDECHETRLRGSVPVPLPLERAEVGGSLLDQGLADRILRLEVVVDIPERYVGSTGDVREARLIEAPLVDEPHSGPDQSRAFVFGGSHKSGV